MLKYSKCRSASALSTASDSQIRPHTFYTGHGERQPVVPKLNLPRHGMVAASPRQQTARLTTSEASQFRTNSALEQAREIRKDLELRELSRIPSWNESVDLRERKRHLTEQHEESNQGLFAEVAELEKKLRLTKYYNKVLVRTLTEERKQWNEEHTVLHKSLVEKESHIHDLVQFSILLERQLAKANTSSAFISGQGNGATNPHRDKTRIEPMQRAPERLFSFQAVKRKSQHTVDVGVETNQWWNDVHSAKVITEDTGRSESNYPMSESLIDEGNIGLVLRHENEWLQRLNSEKDIAINHLTDQLHYTQIMLRKKMRQHNKCDSSQASTVVPSPNRTVQDLQRQNQHLRLFRADLFQIEHERDILRREVAQLSQSQASGESTYRPNRLQQEIRRLRAANQQIHREMKQHAAAATYFVQQNQLLERHLSQLTLQLNRQKAELCSLQKQYQEQEHLISWLYGQLTPQLPTHSYIATIPQQQHEQQPKEQQERRRSISNRSAQHYKEWCLGSNASFQLNLSDDKASCSQRQHKETRPTEQSEVPMKSMRVKRTHSGSSVHDEPECYQKYSLSEDLAGASVESELVNVIKQYFPLQEADSFGSSILRMFSWLSNYIDRRELLPALSKFLEQVSDRLLFLTDRLQKLQSCLYGYFHQALRLTDDDEQ